MRVHWVYTPLRLENARNASAIFRFSALLDAAHLAGVISLTSDIFMFGNLRNKSSKYSVNHRTAPTGFRMSYFWACTALSLNLRISVIVHLELQKIGMGGEYIVKQHKGRKT
jgi:hypothetical protein